ncbi:MAG TPA: aminotransferase class IV [Longimicrobiales bacterium]|nr:aminotransferase class IV [Longimicrobiales bacterium]
MLVYLNGEYVEHGNARVSVDDRGFLFADGVYEVARVYDGRIFLMQPHMERMRHGLSQLRIRDEIVAELPAIADRLLDENQLRSGDATVYIQVTRGAAPRAHAFPPPETAPTVYVIAKPFKQHPAGYFEDGVAAVTVPDTRWSRCDIKSIALLPNVLANQQAKEQGAFEAIFVRNNVLIEGSHSNLFAVIGGQLLTYELCGYILGGITRKLILDRAPELGLHVHEEPIHMSQLDRVDELFLSGTTTEIMPISRLDNRLIGEGKPGPVTRKLQEAFKRWRSE